MSDLNGRAKRAVAGFHARWEIAEKPQPNPYVQRGQTDDTLCAVFRNRVYYNGELVTNRTARVPDVVALTQEQMLNGDKPYDLPQKLVEKALKEQFGITVLPKTDAPAVETSAPAPTKLDDHRKGLRSVPVQRREEAPQMAAQAEPMFNMKG